MKEQKSYIDTIKKIAEEFGVKKLVLFGSALDSESEPNDIDLTCEGLRGKDFFAFGTKLERTLHITIDLVPINPESKFIQHILGKGKVIYGN